MNDSEKIDLILDKLAAIEERLSKTVTSESMASIATLDDVKDLATEMDYAAQEILDAERRRDLNEIRAGLRGMRAVS